MDTRLSRKVIWDVINRLFPIASFQGAGTFSVIIASPLAIFAKIANFAKIASLQRATFGIQFKLSEAGDFSPFSPLHAFLHGRKCRTYSCCFPLALANIRLWPLVPFFQISLKNTELKTTHNTFWGTVACIFQTTFSK